MLRSRLIRYAAYPALMGAVLAGTAAVLADGLPAWPTLAILATAGIAMVALLEWLQPYEPSWRHSQGDLKADLMHGAVNFGLLAGTAYGLHAFRGLLPAGSLWPTQWPLIGQMLLAGLVIDLGLYAMHRFSHRVRWAWKLHAIHHSAERLYWLNGERRHPLSALLMAGPGLGLTVALGAPPLVISAWLTLMSVQLAFQHANLDYRVGPLRRWLGVAEVHRWHHKRDYEDAQVNFGEFFMIWDRLCGTFLDRPETLRAGEVGLREETMPASDWAQMCWPFNEAPDQRDTAFAQYLWQGDQALQQGDLTTAYKRYELAHVLSQHRTRLHVRSHWAFARWAWQAHDMREMAGQLLRLMAAATLTWVWMPKGNTGGARVNALRTMPIPSELRNYMENTR